MEGRLCVWQAGIKCTDMVTDRCSPPIPFALHTHITPPPLFPPCTFFPAAPQVPQSSQPSLQRFTSRSAKKQPAATALGDSMKEVLGS
jgi:hypothetical protein